MLILSSSGRVYAGQIESEKENCMITAKSASAAALTLVGLLFLGTGTQARAQGRSVRTFAYDVAIDAKTFSMTNNDPADKGNPRRGSTFIVYGKIFPTGTIPSGVTEFDPNQPGSIGTWICRGVFLADNANILNGSAKMIVHTTQLFFLPDDEMMLTTEGFEGNVGVSTHRAVTGGTGMFEGITGQALQECIGLNQSGLFDHRFTFTVVLGR
jgi:hypothetical protein